MLGIFRCQHIVGAINERSAARQGVRAFIRPADVRICFGQIWAGEH
jgi:hypothetical protein